MQRMLRSFAILVALCPPSLGAQSQPGDPDVKKGIAQVDNGEYEEAILTLDAAARRLVGDPKRRGDLVQAYVYLGVAYMAKGHDTSAKNRFRDALALDKALSLSPEKFAPRVVEAFEKARDEAKREVANASAPAPAPAKKGGGKGLLWVGLGGTAVAGGALALAGGGGKSPTPSASPTPSPFGVLLDRSFSGLTPGTNQFFDVIVQAAGNLTVIVDWTNGRNDLDLYLSTPACTNANAFPPDVCPILARAESPSARPEMFTTPVQAGTFRVVVAWCGDPVCGTGTESGTVKATLAGQ